MQRLQRAVICKVLSWQSRECRGPTVSQLHEGENMATIRFSAVDAITKCTALINIIISALTGITKRSGDTCKTHAVSKDELEEKVRGKVENWTESERKKKKKTAISVQSGHRQIGKPKLVHFLPILFYLQNMSLEPLENLDWFKIFCVDFTWFQWEILHQNILIDRL